MKNIKGFPGGSDGKESACNSGDLDLIPESGRSSGEGIGYPLQYFCLENSMAKRAWWAIYSPWDHKESNMTKQLTLYLFIYLFLAKDVVQEYKCIWIILTEIKINPRGILRGIQPPRHHIHVLTQDFEEAWKSAFSVKLPWIFLEPTKVWVTPVLRILYLLRVEINSTQEDKL